MSASLAVGFSEGTHRWVSPTETWSRVAPFLAEMGITRTANITGLDRLGIPTWIAVRPTALMIQVSNGKGISHAAAKLGAVMEAIEHWHAENPVGAFHGASECDLRRRNHAYVPADEIPGYISSLHVTDRRVVPWVRAERLPDNTPVWIPASAVFQISPMFFQSSTNGLGAGNHLIEATLHAFYELIERDAMARFTAGGVSLPRGESRVVDLDTVPEGLVTALRNQLARAGVTLILIRVESHAPVCTFWATLIDAASPFACSLINVGYGSHLSPTIAAVRAITEATQSRLTFIHGSREDLSPTCYEFGEVHQRLLSFFRRQHGDLRWADIDDHSSMDLARDLDSVIAGLRVRGFRRIYRVDLTTPRFKIPVVRMLVPGLSHYAETDMR
jgi:ribosomal protein S12 methylthiotransferase accessory factor